MEHITETSCKVSSFHRIGMENVTETARNNYSIHTRPPDAVYISNAVLTLMASLVCGFGNILVIISIAKFTYLRSTTNVFVVLLACFDLFLGLIAIFEQYILLKGVFYGQTSKILCKVLAVVTFTAGKGDMLSVMFMAVDRYIYIRYPLKYSDIVTYKRVTIAVCFTITYMPISKNSNSYIQQRSGKGHRLQHNQFVQFGLHNVFTFTCNWYN